MDNKQLNERLIKLGNQATNAHEILRGVTDALAVIGQSTVRAATDDFDSIQDADAWRDEANAAADQSEELLNEAAKLLRRTANRLEHAAERLDEDRDD